jgi:hypothetical protein
MTGALFPRIPYFSLIDSWPKAHTPALHTLGCGHTGINGEEVQ